jgi:hypothetical protein
VDLVAHAGGVGDGVGGLGGWFSWGDSCRRDWLTLGGDDEQVEATGQKNTVLTLYELREGEATASQGM